MVENIEFIKIIRLLKSRIRIILITLVHFYSIGCVPHGGVMSIKKIKQNRKLSK